MVGIAQSPVKLSELESITRHEVDQYAGNSFKATYYTIFDDIQKLYVVVVVPDLPRPWPSRVVVMAQIVDDKVIILEDTSLDKPLVNALMANGGIPREKIVLAYEGEIVPEA